MPVGELLERMDSRELAEWQAYLSLESEQSDASEEEVVRRGLSQSVQRRMSSMKSNRRRYS